MAKNFQPLILLGILFIASSFVVSCVAQPCANYRFSGNQHYSSCTDLPVLNSSLYWNYHQSSSTVNLAFKHSGISGRRWIAWAINPNSGGMIGSQAIVAFPRTDGTLAAYSSPIASYGTQLQPGNLSFPVFNISATYENNEMIIFATIGLPGNQTTVNHLWQDGPLSGNIPMMHRVDPSSPNLRSFGRLDFLSGRITSMTGGRAGPRKTLKYVHGVLNTISWGILMPIGAIVARYMKVFHSASPLWFYLHIGCQISAYLVGVAGFATGLSLGQKSTGFQYRTHRNIGIALFCLATTQVGVGFVRPHKDSKFRPYFNWFHYLVGYTTIILSVDNIFRGFQILSGAKIWQWMYIGIIATLGLTALLLEAYKWFIVKRDKSKTVEKNMATSTV